MVVQAGAPVRRILPSLLRPFPPPGNPTRDEALAVLAHALAPRHVPHDLAAGLEQQLWLDRKEADGGVGDAYLCALRALWDVLSPRVRLGVSLWDWGRGVAADAREEPRGYGSMPVPLDRHAPAPDVLLRRAGSVAVTRPSCNCVSTRFPLTRPPLTAPRRARRADPCWRTRCSRGA